MPTTPKGIQGVIAVGEDTSVTKLGRIIWFSVPDEAVSLRALKKNLALHGLPPSLAPSDTKLINVFKRAMRVHEGRTQNEGRYIDTDVATVRETPEDCIYQVSRLTRDLDERVVEYVKLLRVIFNKNTDEVHFNKLPGAPQAECLPIMEAIEDFMEKNGSKVTGAKVRGIVRNFVKEEPDEKRGIEGLSGENLRGKAGGIYFVPERNFEMVKAISGMLQELYKGKAYLHAIPLADGTGERDLIRAHHTSNVRQEMIEMVGELRGLTSPDRERSPRSDVIANKWAQFHTLARRASRYKEIIQDDVEELQIMAETVKKQLDKL